MCRGMSRCVQVNAQLSSLPLYKLRVLPFSAQPTVLRLNPIFSPNKAVGFSEGRSVTFASEMLNSCLCFDELSLRSLWHFCWEE